MPPKGVEKLAFKSALTTRQKAQVVGWCRKQQRRQK
jgi:hypothetical protein